jgi:hypothetical protein
LSVADKIEVKIVPSDTLAQGRKKLAVFRAVWVKMLKPAPVITTTNIPGNFAPFPVAAETVYEVPIKELKAVIVR